MRLKPLGVISAALAVSLWAGAAAQANELQVKVWAAACATCHGTNGNSVGAMVRLAGADAKATLETLLAHKRGERKGTIMHQIARGYSDEQLAQIANYFAAQR
jgi:cytochrome c553